MNTQIVEQSGAVPFAEVGRRREVGGDSPFLLTGDDAWYVEKGAIDVFRVEVRGPEAVGCRHHLFRVRAGQLLLGVTTGAQKLALVAVGTRGTELVHFASGRFAEISSDSAHHPVIARLLDDWVAALCGSVANELPPEDCLELAPGEYPAVTNKRQVRPDKGTLWIKAWPGSLLLLGRPELEVSGGSAIPFSEHLWLEVPEKTTMVAEETAAMLSSAEIWQGLAELHRLYFEVIAAAAGEAEARAREKLRHKTAADSRALTSALGLVAEALDPRSLRGAEGLDTEDSSDDLLLAACRIVGVSLGFTVEAPPPSQSQAVATDPVDAIARASGFRVRTVLLREGWWRQQSGPLLAFVDESERPMALLQTARGYVLHDPEERTEVVVTEALAETLRPQAYTFYSPLPARAIGFYGLLRFGLRGCGRDLLTFLMMGVAGGLLGLVTPIATRAIFNDIIPGAARDELLQVTLMLLVFALADAMFSVTGALALVRMEGKSGAAMQAAFWDRMLSLPLSFFRPYTAGNLASRAMGIERIRQVLSGQVINSLTEAIFSLFHLGLLFYFSARLAGWSVLLIFIAFAVTLVLGRLQVLAERRVSDIRNRLSGTVLQLLSSVGKLRVAGAEVQAFAQWARTFSQQRRFQFRSRSRANVLAAFNAGFPLVANLVIFAMAAPLLTEGGVLRFGDFLAFIASFTIALRGILGAGQAINQVTSLVPLVEQASPVLEALPEVDSGKADPGRLTGEIDIHQVSFRYSEDAPLVLQNVTLKIRRGEFAALVGPSGSGKSTLLRQLLAFEEPGSGSVYYDGQDLSGLDTQAVRAQLGVVLQNGRLVSGDLFTNIVGSSRATLDDAWDAARMAGLDADIKAMPMGMHTVITSGGGTLSGGQRQRLMIARALVRKPRILFFDEATSALDNRTQAIVTKSLDNLQATRIVVAHRLSTIQNADRIYVLDRGRLVESGTYLELMELGGAFRELAERQMT